MPSLQEALGLSPSTAKFKKTKNKTFYMYYM